MKRSVFCLVAIMLLLPMSASSQSVSDEQTWTDQTLDGDLVVSGHLTIQDSLTITSGSSITVTQTGTLTINGDMNGEAPSSYARYAGQGQTTLQIPIDSFSGSGNVKFAFNSVAVGPSLGNASLNLSDVVMLIPENATELEFSNVDMNSAALNLTIDITLFAAIDVSSITITADGHTPDIIQMWELNHGGVMTWIDHTWTLDVSGTMAMSGDVIGAAINCAGTCTITNTNLTGSAPIHVNGSLSISDSTISGSKTDEDIIVHDDATLTYTNNVGTGGSTDAWIRLLSSRIISTGVAGVHISVEDLGYYSSTRTAVTDATGSAELSQSEGNRIVEWMDGSGVYHSEESSLVATLITPWGDYTTEIENLEHSPVVNVSLSLPNVDLLEVKLEGESAEVDSAVQATVKVSNTGNAPATPRIECFANDEAAETSPPMISAPIAPGETVEIEFTWRESESGTSALNCVFMEANVDGMEAILSTGDWSDSVSANYEFTERVEEEDSILPAVIVAILVAAIITGLVIYARKQREKDYDKEVNED